MPWRGCASTLNRSDIPSHKKSGHHKCPTWTNVRTAVISFKLSVYFKENKCPTGKENALSYSKSKNRSLNMQGLSLQGNLRLKNFSPQWFCFWGFDLILAARWLAEGKGVTPRTLASFIHSFSHSFRNYSLTYHTGHWGLKLCAQIRECRLRHNCWAHPRRFVFMVERE